MMNWSSPGATSLRLVLALALPCLVCDVQASGALRTEDFELTDGPRMTNFDTAVQLRIAVLKSDRIDLGEY